MAKLKLVIQGNGPDEEGQETFFRMFNVPWSSLKGKALHIVNDMAVK
jgi:hypothetical protein